MGHNVGLAESYYRPQEREILEDYLKAVPELTFYAKKEDAGITEEEAEALREKIRRMERSRRRRTSRYWASRRARPRCGGAQKGEAQGALRREPREERQKTLDRAGWIRVACRNVRKLRSFS